MKLNIFIGIATVLLIAVLIANYFVFRDIYDQWQTITKEIR